MNGSIGSILGNLYKRHDIKDLISYLDSNMHLLKVNKSVAIIFTLAFTTIISGSCDQCPALVETRLRSNKTKSKLKSLFSLVPQCMYNFDSRKAESTAKCWHLMPAWGAYH